MANDKEQPLLEVGKITRPHGVRGELKAHLYFEGSRSLWEVDRLVLRSPSGREQNLAIESVRGGPKGPILALVGVDGRDAAEALRDHTIWVPRVELEPLAPGEYYLIDLVGCQVVLAGERLGKITQVRPDPSIDTLVIELSDGSLAEQPLLDAWVGKVDIEARVVELLNDDGLIR